MLQKIAAFTVAAITTLGITYSADASLVEDLPLAPVYLLIVVPQEMIALFLFSYTSAKLGSYAAVTSALRHLELDLTTAGFLESA